MVALVTGERQLINDHEEVGDVFDVHVRPDIRN
jgi:hypothetical protein